MSSKSEVGHNKNVANYSSAIQILNEMGPLYSAPVHIQINNLTPLEGLLATSVNALNVELAINKTDVADRQTEYKKLDQKVTMSNNYFKSLNVDAKDKANVNALAKKIRGDSKKKIIDPVDPLKDTHSDKQLSHDSLLANFRTYIALLASFAEYTPNETEITTASLTTFANTLGTLNTNANASNAALITGRKDRNDLIYFKSPNVIDLMRDVKAYVKSLGEPGKPYYKALVRLKFSDYKA